MLPELHPIRSRMQTLRARARTMGMDQRPDFAAAIADFESQYAKICELARQNGSVRQWQNAARQLLPAWERVKRTYEYAKQHRQFMSLSRPAPSEASRLHA